MRNIEAELPKAPPDSPWHRLRRLPLLGPVILARPRWLVAVLAGAAAYLLLPRMPTVLRAVASWDVGGAVFLIAIALGLGRAGPARLRRRAQSLDQGATTILLLTLAGVAVSLFGIIDGLKEAKILAGKDAQQLPVLLAAATILTSWTLTQVSFAIHYAHLYYGDDDEDATRHAGGLEFPGGAKPDFLDFVYFAFVLGMTFQVSDVAITDTTPRRVATLHGVVSFFFNTVILALAVNIGSSLLG